MHLPYQFLERVDYKNKKFVSKKDNSRFVFFFRTKNILPLNTPFENNNSAMLLWYLIFDLLNQLMMISFLDMLLYQQVHNILYSMYDYNFSMVIPYEDY